MTRVLTTSLKRNSRKELFDSIEELKIEGFKVLSQQLDDRKNSFIATMQKITK